MDDGIITKSEDKKGIMRVNLNGLDKLEVGVDKISLICFDSSFWVTRIYRNYSRK